MRQSMRERLAALHGARGPPRTAPPPWLPCGRAAIVDARVALVVRDGRQGVPVAVGRVPPPLTAASDGPWEVMHNARGSVCRGGGIRPCSCPARLCSDANPGRAAMWDPAKSLRRLRRSMNTQSRQHLCKCPKLNLRHFHLEIPAVNCLWLTARSPSAVRCRACVRSFDIPCRCAERQSELSEKRCAWVAAFATLRQLRSPTAPAWRQENLAPRRDIASS